MTGARGLQLEGVRYHADVLRALARKKVHVRVDPEDAGHVYVHAPPAPSWIECFSEHYGTFHGCSRRLLRLASVALRGTRVLLLDEAHHMTCVRGTRYIEEHLDEIKSFESTTRIRQVLFGTEQVKDLLRGNAQLARRTKEVFYDAYDYAKPQEREAFNQIMGQLFTHLPFRDLETFESQFDYLFMRSAGCVGVLKDWLSDALELALSAGRDRLLMADLEETALRKGRLDEVTEGIKVFREFARPSADLSAIRAKLGMPADSAPSKRSSRGSVSHQRRPGERNPHRDPVPRETE